MLRFSDKTHKATKSQLPWLQVTSVIIVAQKGHCETMKAKPNGLYLLYENKCKKKKTSNFRVFGSNLK